METEIQFRIERAETERKIKSARSRSEEAQPTQAELAGTLLRLVQSGMVGTSRLGGICVLQPGNTTSRSILGISFKRRTKEFRMKLRDSQARTKTESKIECADTHIKNACPDWVYHPATFFKARLRPGSS